MRDDSIDTFGNAVTGNRAMKRVCAVLRRAAPTGATILLEGETGTGKTMLARAVHDESARAGGPFVVLDCGSLPANLVENELFGHERGAYTGACAAQPGVFELAHGGTIFLDEIGELALELQTRLLRVLDERRVRRIGAGVERVVDLRVLCATNRDLAGDVERGRFRRDLFFRIAGLRVAVPPLRDRPEDLARLADHHWRELTGETAVPPDLMEAFRAHSWPGNIRELKHAVERALLGVSPDVVPRAGSLPAAARRVRTGTSFARCKASFIADWERRYLAELLALHRGNLSRAARAAGMDRNHLRRLLMRYGADRSVLPAQLPAG